MLAAAKLAKKRKPNQSVMSIGTAQGISPSAQGIGGLFGNFVGWIGHMTLGPGLGEDRFVATKLILGQPEAAAAGLKVALGLDDDQIFAKLLARGIEQVIDEVTAAGSDDDKANLRYCHTGRACERSDLPPHVARCIDSGWYHGGRLGSDDFDYGHAGMTLDDFVNHPSAKVAGLNHAQMLCLRLYTTSSFPLFNRPLRAGEVPHPLRMCVYHLAEGLKALRRVEARDDPEAFNRVMYLYRGMKDIALSDKVRSHQARLPRRAAAAACVRACVCACGKWVVGARAQGLRAWGAGCWRALGAGLRGWHASCGSTAAAACLVRWRRTSS